MIRSSSKSLFTTVFRRQRDELDFMLVTLIISLSCFISLTFVFDLFTPVGRNDSYVGPLLWANVIFISL